MSDFYSENENGRDFVIGDLHGCYDLLINILEEINFNKEKDRMFSVGDLIDRGPKSMECLRLIKESWFHAVMGNHEDMMIDHLLQGNNPYCWDNNGGLWHYDADQEELMNLADLVNLLPLSITVETAQATIGICHAQPPTTDWNDAVSPNEKQETVMLWARTLIEDSDVENIKNIDMTIHGHTPKKEPKTVGNSLFIDTGAFYTGNLTCRMI